MINHFDVLDKVFGSIEIDNEEFTEIWEEEIPTEEDYGPAILLEGIEFTLLVQIAVAFEEIVEMIQDGDVSELAELVYENNMVLFNIIKNAHERHHGVEELPEGLW